MARKIDTIKVRKKAKIRNGYNQVPHPAQDTIWESEKNTRKDHILEISNLTPGKHSQRAADRKDLVLSSGSRVEADQHCVVVRNRPVTAADEDGLLQGHPGTVVRDSLNS